MSEHPLNPHGAVIAGRSGCALGTINAERIPGCQAYLRKAVDYANGPNVDAVVLTAAWFMHFTVFEDTEHYGRPEPLRPETDRELDLLRQVVAQLVHNGKRVYIVLQIPIGAALDPRQMIQRALFPPGFTVVKRPIVKADIAKLFQPINTRLRKVAQDTGATIIDPLDSLCEADVCPTILPDGEPIYYNYDHLRPSYVRDHVTYLDETILDATPAR
jgi:hypothetical protein